MALRLNMKFKKIKKYFSLGKKVDNLSTQMHALSINSSNCNQKVLMNLGRQACWNISTKKTIDSLYDVEFRVYSQWGEDGIVEWLIQNLPIKNTTFVEFGVENYGEANTRFLLENRNWKGLIMDGSDTYMNYVKQDQIYWRHDLRAVSAFITCENINSLLEEHGYGNDLGILSIDIDGNDYWVLDAIKDITASILICECNPIFGDQYAITVPYKSNFSRFDAHYSGLYFGASINAIKGLAEERGYEFVGTCSNGINAFFVKRELFSGIKDRIKDIVAMPARHRDARDKSGNLQFTAGIDRLDLIADMPVVMLDDNNNEVKIGELKKLYSDEWIALM